MTGLSVMRRQEPVDVSNEEFLSITREKYYRAIEGAMPMFAWFSLTEECNLHCRYCFTDATPSCPASMASCSCASLSPMCFIEIISSSICRPV